MVRQIWTYLDRRIRSVARETLGESVLLPRPALLLVESSEFGRGKTDVFQIPTRDE
jgi:hypothetical protein